MAKNTEKNENTMCQSDFVNLIAEKGYTKRDAKQLVADVINTLEECLINGISVTFSGFGTFRVVHMEGRNMHCGTFVNEEGMVYVPEHNYPKFVASAGLKRAMRLGEDTDYPA